MPRALIIGVAGQDGSYLAELLLEKKYEVHGVARRSTSLDRIQYLHGDAAFKIHPADLTDPATLRKVVAETAPDEVYHLAAQSHVGASFEQIESTCEVVGLGTLRLLEAARGLPRPPRFFHASSSEIFGRPEAAPQDERTPLRPVTPYGCAKAFATQMVSIYRQTFGLFACNGILYNHESPHRGESFVTRKICRAAAAIKLGRQEELRMGDTSTQRDWGHARDYVAGMWAALQHPTAEDFVFATGRTHRVEDVLEIAFREVGLDWRKYIRQDPQFMRPEEPRRLVGDAGKAARLLNWKPRTTFEEMIAEMTRA